MTELKDMAISELWDKIVSERTTWKSSPVGWMSFGNKLRMEH